MVDLLQGSDGIVYHFEDPVAFSELAIMLELSGPDARNSIPGEFYSKELLEKAIVRETGAGKAISVSTTRADSEECEPDPHPAFHTLSSNSEFALDIIVDLSDIQSSVLQSGGSMGITNSAKREQDSQVAVNVKTPVGSRSPSEDRDMLPNAKGVLSRDIGLATSAKMAEEEFAHSLQFSATYDPKMLHNYECLTCRKVRMLHVLHRLGREDKLDLFKEPVTEAIAPTYFDVIKSPMDLSTMRHNVLDGKYTRVNFRGFRDDFELMCLNAVTFNSKERDFLIWREAWRFYGQGQRIFRQTAPKSRMKQRGGRHYDALLVAAKRQLPNNSALAGGKKQFNGDPLGDDGEYEDDDEIDDEEDGDTGSDAGTEAQKRGNTSAHNDSSGEKEQAARLERTYSYARDTCFRCYNRKERETQALLQRTKALTQIWTAAARKRKIDAEKCPLCDRKWDADHEELMQCDACDCWVHPPCDALLKAEPKRYQKLVNDPNAVYICAACRPKEREHLAGKVLGGDKWRCQLLIDNIQRKRSQCESGWNEARAQMEQNEHWKRLADHTSVYLYVLRLGEECLRNFSFRSLNFQGDWFRLTKQQELDDAGLILPEWLMRKASRYLRFKRYVRGPRAAARRRERKTQSFYSKQGVGLNTQKDASAICPIVSEAASCAALLACVHLLYGWRPLPEVVLHLLSIDKDNAKGLRAGERQKLGEPLLTRLRMGENNDTDTSKPKMTLEQEVAAIKEQYDRRAGKRHLVREPDSDLMLFGFGDVAAETKVPATSSKLHVATKDLEQKEHAASSVDSNETKTVIPPSVKRAGDGQSSPTATLMQSSTHGPKPMVHLTTVSPLQGWPTKMPEISDDDNSVDEADTEGFSEAIMSLPFEDSRFCALCYMIGDNTACGRLLYTEPETWVHVNCALWSMEVFEDVSGVLHKVQKARNRSRLIRCDACGLMGATIGCSILRCTTHYHFPCAVDAGVAFLPNGETCCPHPSHLDSMARRLEVAGNITGKPLSTPTIIEVVDASNKMDKDDGHSGGTTREAAENGTALTPNKDDSVHSANGSAEEDDKDGKSSTESVVSTPESTAVAKDDQSTISTAEREPVMKVENADSAITPSQQVNSNDIVTTAKPVPVVQSEHVLPVINPRPEPRRRLFSDPPIIVIDVRKKRSDAKRGIKPRPMCYRVGALTVHTLGHVFVGNTSFHTRSAIYPLGFRSSRIFWSTRHLAKRCLYECVISSTEIEERRARQKDCGTNGGEAGVNDSVQQWSRPRAVFKIVPSDDKERPIVASSAEDALIELRSRVVALYEEHKSFSASPRGSEQGQASTVVEAERNPFLKRSSWFSFALSGDYFFGFGLPEVTRYIEELPYAATAAVGRRAIARKLQQQQQRQGQSPLAASSATTWANTSRKRSHDTMELSPAAVSSTLPAVEEDEKLYEFSQVLPSAEEFQTAQRVMEQLVRAEQRARQSSGSARTDGFEGNRLFGAPKKQKTMPRRQALNKEATNEPVAGVSNGNGGSGGVAMDLEHLPITMQYRELRRRPFDERLLVRKSSIHGYGLFLKEPVSEGQMIVEYQGHMIGQRVADERERRYEEQGIGSCYMFRLDESTIIDATRCGNLARFINHSCDPKAFARVVSVEGGEKKIVIFAKRAIAVGDEVTYDYKFPIEDEAIRCDCNAPNCIGRMN
ncbi:hypothetical protein PHYBOEH_001996 [Phytophthora boehmeriae]|uniref:Histone-lysine N-methyltransferase n=1 Tax=Phytophthora boehmeriae TaxID=109152 RepID=A0A8T1WRE2_9STRA|nr:hypothetical protein PHYBOEH_001996 [Phytophthora boehmeriae]